MEIPKKLKIGGHEYKVIFPYHFSERGDRAASHDPPMNQIRIDDRDSWSHEIKPDSSIAVSFLHELFHACDRITGNDMFADEKGEKMNDALAEALYQILHDNKIVF